MTATNLPTVSDAQKIQIQRAVSQQFPTGVIGVGREERLVALLALNQYLFSCHLDLCFSEDGTKVAETFMPTMLDDLALEGLKFYANRRDYLSVTDYVTDLPEILNTATLLCAIPKTA